MLKVMESTSVPTLSIVLPMFGLLMACFINENANTVYVVDDDVATSLLGGWLCMEISHGKHSISEKCVLLCK
jgi:hypothetical protein